MPKIDALHWTIRALDKKVSIGVLYMAYTACHTERQVGKPRACSRVPAADCQETTGELRAQDVYFEKKNHGCRFTWQLQVRLRSAMHVLQMSGLFTSVISSIP